MMDRRIHIAGGPGSGKTTLAHQVAERLNVPCYELDALGYEGGAGAARTLEARLAEVHRIAVQPGWVTEGIYLDWTVELLEAAERIVWLDLPWRVAGWRIFIRHVRAELRGNNQHRGWGKLFDFLRWSRDYYQSSNFREELKGDAAVNRAKTEEALRPYQAKVVRCVRPADVQGVLEEMDG